MWLSTCADAVAAVFGKNAVGKSTSASSDDRYGRGAVNPKR